jgi:hypothetical protein
VNSLCLIRSELSLKVLWNWSHIYGWFLPTVDSFMLGYGRTLAESLPTLFTYVRLLTLMDSLT